MLNVKHTSHPRLPDAIFADQGVSEDHELARDGDEGDLGRFSNGPQSAVERTHVGIKPRG